MTDFSLLQDFIVETVEHLEEMETHLRRLEADPDNRETLDNIFRFVHTIKGSADYLGIKGLAGLSHKLENLLEALRRNEHPVDRETIDLVLAVRDRMGLLVKDLETTQTEQTVFADLVERLQTLRASIPAEKCEISAPPANVNGDSLTDEARNAEYEEEFDEELFTIFIDQLVEGLTSLSAQTAALRNAACDDRLGILDNCLSCVDPLHSSANYMGYDPLVALYDGWRESILNARERLGTGDDTFLSDFIRDYMEANIAAVTDQFPRLRVDSLILAESAAVTPPPSSPPALDLTTTADSAAPIGDLLHADAADHLPSASSAPADTQADDSGDATDLFSRLSRSFDDRRQQGVAPVRAAETAAMAAELFSTADGMVPPEDEHLPETTPHAETDETGPHAHNETAPVEAPTPTKAEVIEDAPTAATPAEALIDADLQPPETSAQENDSDNYEEEYDEELFRIFVEQLEENLGALKTLADALAGAHGDDRGDLLDACLRHIDPLRSSANYMGYSRLTDLYDEWVAAIREARTRHTNGEDEFLAAFATNTMEANIATVVERFPQIRLADPAPDGPALTTTEDMVVTATDSHLPADIPEDILSTEENVAEHAATEEAMEPALSLPVEDDATPGHFADEQNDGVENSLLHDFLVETVEHLEEMEGSLLHLEKEPGHQATLDDIFRSAHTIKGAAEYLGMARIADLSHQLENLLDQMRRNERPADDETIDLLIAARDRIGLLTEDLAQSGQEDTAIDDLLERIQNLQNNPPAQTTMASEPAAETVPGLDHHDTDPSDFEIPLFADTTDNGGESPKHEIPETPAAEDTPQVISITAAIETAAQNDNAIATAKHPESADRRAPDETGRRRSDRIGDKILKQSIRVDAAKIDALMNQVGELVVSRAWFAQLFSEMRELQQNLKQRFKLDTREMKKVKGLTFRLSEATVALGRVANELQEGVMKVRMLPIAQLFNRYPRLVFDLVRDTDKQVELEIRGEDTELDKMVIEEISDPLIHIIRNAVDHGVETVEERQRHGKPETATIRLEAYHEGNHVVIEITDDGRGLNLDRIRAKALSGNFAARDEIERMSPKELTGFIMQPGFSTADRITHTSGRGVGMDVVKKNIEKLNGTIEIDTTPGIETRFRIKIPLTLAIIPALLIKVRQELFTIPLATVEETLRIAEGDISTIEGIEVMHLRENTLPLVRLDNLFKIDSPAAIDRSFVVVVSTGMKRVGLVVDELLGQEEVVIKPLEDYLQERSGFSGATILGDGRISLILDIYELVNLSIDREVQKKTKAAAI